MFKTRFNDLAVFKNRLLTWFWMFLRWNHYH